MRRLIPLGLLALLCGCGAPAPSEDTGTTSEAYVTDLGTIRTRGLCLDVFSFNTRNGNLTLDLWDCNGLVNQGWVYNADTHAIVSKYNGKCLDNIGFDHTSVGLWDCNGLPNQRWSFDSLSGEIINQYDGKCLRAQYWDHSPGNSHGSGDALFLAGCHDSEWPYYSTFAWD